MNCSTNWHTGENAGYTRLSAKLLGTENKDETPAKDVADVTKKGKER